MEEIKIRELPDKNHIVSTDYIIVDDEDGTKKVRVNKFRSLVLTSLYFDSVDELKNNTEIGLQEGDVCQTLGYYKPGDGGAATYVITYNPAAVEDGKLIHYLSYSDTLRAELLKGDSINVHQFGAKGDGSTDDTIAIQEAINNFNKIEFNSNMTYVTRTPLYINRSNIIINGNGSDLYPHYSDGLTIGSDTEIQGIISNIVLDNLHVNCNRTSCGVRINNSINISILNGDIYNITSKGVSINNSEFINLERCDLEGFSNGSLITLEGSDLDDVISKSSRIVNIHNCSFKNYNKGIHVLSTGETSVNVNNTVNIVDCYFKSSQQDSSSIYIACPIEIMNIKNTIVDACDTFLYFGGASSGFVSCMDLSCINTTHIFNVGTSTGILSLNGNINTDTIGKMFSNMNGKLHSNIAWEFISKGASFTNQPIGELCDSVGPMQYSASKGYSFTSSTLTLSEIRNMHINWSSSTSNLDTINNGIKGQLLYIRSTTNKSIMNVTNKIKLSSASIQLSSCKGVLLRYDGMKWVQIQ